MAWSQTAADVQSTCAFTKYWDFSSCIVHINASVQWAFALIYIKVTCCHPVLLFRTACFVCIWHTFTFYVLSLALSLGVVILCRPQLRDLRSPRVWKSLIPACIRPSSHDVLLRLSQFWCHSVHAFHYAPQNGNKSHQGLLYLAALSLQKPGLFNTGAVLMLADQHRVSGNNHFLAVFWRSVLLANAAWIVLRETALSVGQKDWKHKSKLMGRKKSRQSSQNPEKEKILKKGA